MNHTRLISLAALSFLLLGCGDKDEDYYFKNIEKAKEKIQLCENKFRDAFRTGDKDALKKLEDDVECDSAKKALYLFNKNQQEKEAAERERIKKEKIEAATKEVNDNFSSQSWQEYIKSYANSECNEVIFNSSEQCLAMKALYEDKFQVGLSELSKIPFDKLSLLESEYCSKDMRIHSACQVWKTAVDNQEQNIIKKYVQNYDLLKTDYNKCVEAVSEAKKQEGSWRLISKIQDSYPCKQVIRARSKLQLGYGIDKIME